MLPKVSSDIFLSMAASIGPDPVSQVAFAIEQMNKLATNNPEILDYLNRLAKIINDAEVSREIVFATLYVYRALESQAEADAMAQEFKIE